jgi:hypothetical protein
MKKISSPLANFVTLFGPNKNALGLLKKSKLIKKSLKCKKCKKRLNVAATHLQRRLTFS